MYLISGTMRSELLQEILFSPVDKAVAERQQQVIELEHRLNEKIRDIDGAWRDYMAIEATTNDQFLDGVTSAFYLGLRIGQDTSTLADLLEAGHTSANLDEGGSFELLAREA